MQRLLDEFLDFARGARRATRRWSIPLPWCDTSSRMRSAPAPVDVDLVEGEGTLTLRPVAIRRAVENLIGNAVRYGNRAEVSVLLTDKSLRIRVEDDGPGIPADRRDEAMKPFTQAGSRAQSEPGHRRRAGPVHCGGHRARAWRRAAPGRKHPAGGIARGYRDRTVALVDTLIGGRSNASYRTNCGRGKSQ